MVVLGKGDLERQGLASSRMGGRQRYTITRSAMRSHISRLGEQTA